MDFDEYTLAVLVRTRLEEARALTARRQLVARHRPSVRARLGVVLIAMGRWLLGDPADAPAPVPADASHA